MSILRKIFDFTRDEVYTPKSIDDSVTPAESSADVPSEAATRATGAASSDTSPAGDIIDLCSVCGYQTCRCEELTTPLVSAMCPRCSFYPCQCRTEEGTLVCHVCKVAPGKFFSHAGGGIYTATCGPCFYKALPKNSRDLPARKLLAQYNLPAEAEE